MMQDVEGPSGVTGGVEPEPSTIFSGSAAVGAAEASRTVVMSAVQHIANNNTAVLRKLKKVIRQYPFSKTIGRPVSSRRTKHPRSTELCYFSVAEVIRADLFRGSPPGWNRSQSVQICFSADIAAPDEKALQKSDAGVTLVYNGPVIHLHAETFFFMSRDRLVSPG